MASASEVRILDLDDGEDMVMGAMYGEPKRCTKVHPCCCCSPKENAKVCAYVVIVISVLKMGAYAIALAEHDYWYKPWYNELFSHKKSNSTHEHHTNEGKDAESKFSRKCMKLFIVLIVFTLARVVASLVVICIKRPSPVPFLMWILVEAMVIIVNIIVITLVHRYIRALNEELGIKKVDLVWVLLSLSVVLGFDLPLVAWFMWIMGGNATQLDHRAQASVFRAADLDKLVNPKASDIRPAKDDNDDEPLKIPTDPRKFQVTAPGYVDTW